MRSVTVRYRFRQTVVALDASVESRAALERGAELASMLDTELGGLFVEDEDLLSASTLPFAREVTLSGHLRALEAQALEGQLQAQARIARRMLDEVARLRHMRCEFEVVRDHLQSALLAAARRHDLLMLPRSSDPVARGTGLARLAADIAASAAASVLVFDPRRGIPAGPVVTVVDGSEAAEQMVDVAAGLARRTGRPLRVLAAGNDRQGTETLPPGTDLQPGGADVAAVVEALAAPGVALIVASADTDLFTADDIAAMIRRSAAPVLVLRSPMNDDSGG